MKQQLQDALDDVNAKFPLGSVFDGFESGYGKGAIVSEILIDQDRDNSAIVRVYTRSESYLQQDKRLRVCIYEVSTDVSFVDMDRLNDEVEKEIDSMTSEDFEKIGWSKTKD